MRVRVSGPDPSILDKTQVPVDEHLRRSTRASRRGRDKQPSYRQSAKIRARLIWRQLMDSPSKTLLRKGTITPLGGIRPYCGLITGQATER